MNDRSLQEQRGRRGVRIKAKTKTAGALLPLLLCSVAIFGLWLRTAHLPAWKDQAERTFLDGSPLPTTFDAPYYMRLARDLAEGRYDQPDALRGIPHCPPRPSPPPLLSVLAAAVHRITGLSFSWIAFGLPPLLGVLSCLALYACAIPWMHPAGAVAACTVMSTAPLYVYRTCGGRFDTDSLNVGFPLLLVACLSLYITSKPHRPSRLVWALVCLLCFLWWWDQSPQTPLLMASVPLAASLWFCGKEHRYPHGMMVLLFFAFLAALLVLFKGTDVFSQMYRTALGQFSYIMDKPAEGAFPNIGLSVSEQGRPAWDTGAFLSSGHRLTFVAGLAGLAWFLAARPKALALFSTLLVLAFWGFSSAQRLLIFASPPIALGFGWIVDRVFTWHRLSSRRFPRTVIAGGLVLLAAIPPAAAVLQRPAFPSEDARVVQGMELIERATPPDAAIWAWWDHGYHIQYWARRATFTDGALHGGESVVYSALPLAATDTDFAADFMIFYSARGVAGIHDFFRSFGLSSQEGFSLLKDIFSHGPQYVADVVNRLQPGRPPEGASWVDFFFPRPRRPVYLFLDSLWLKTAYWWYWFGTWDPARKTGIHPVYAVLSPLKLGTPPSGSAQSPWVDPSRGVLFAGHRRFPLSSLAWSTSTGDRRIRRFSSGQGWHVDVFPQLRFGVLLRGGALARSLFHRLFWNLDPNLRSRFRLKAFSGTAYRLWEVLPRKAAGISG